MTIKGLDDARRALSARLELLVSVLLNIQHALAPFNRRTIILVLVFVLDDLFDDLLEALLTVCVWAEMLSDFNELLGGQAADLCHTVGTILHAHIAEKHVGFTGIADFEI